MQGCEFLYIQYIHVFGIGTGSKLKNCLFAASSCPAILAPTQNLIASKRSFFVIILVDFIFSAEMSVKQISVK